MKTNTAPTLYSTLIAGATAGLVIGLVEIATLAPGGRLFGASASQGLVASAHLLGMTGLAGVALGLGLGLVLPACVAALAPTTWWRRFVWPRTARETPPAERIAHAAWWFGGLVGLFPAAAAAWVAGGVAHGFAQQALARPFSALAALAGVVAGLVLMFPARAVTRWLLTRVTPGGAVLGLPVSALPVVGLALVGAAVAVRISGLELGAFKLGGYGAALALVVLAVFLAGRLSGTRALRPGLWSILTLALIGGGAGWAIYGMESAPVSRRVIPLDGHLSRVAVERLRKLLDRDGDGYSALLAGGDCDDTNPEVGPHAREIPGNGIDDNCSGADAPLEDVAAPPPPPRLEAPPPGEPPPPRYEPKPYNVLFLLIDTLRPDHLGLYGYERPTSPNIDAFAAEATVFEYAYAQAPNTPRSMPSIFTGRYPSRIAWVQRFHRFSDLKPENETIFEVFQQGGWRTETVSAHWYFERAPGLKDGVDLWDNEGFLSIKDSNTQSAAPDLTPRVVKRLEHFAQEKTKFFLFAHYFDPHSRYMNQKTAKIFGNSLLDKYDSEISFVDMHLKPVFDTLRDRGLLENTVIVITSDHGEAFKEHGYHFHGRTVYEEEIRVPLIVRLPDQPSRRLNQPVALVDLAPTLGDLVGLPLKQAQGVSLVPLLTELGEYPAERLIFLEQLPYPHWEEHVVGVVDGARQKVIRNITRNVTEAFDLVADPAEKRNLLDTEPERFRKLQDRLRDFIDRDPG